MKPVLLCVRYRRLAEKGIFFWSRLGLSHLDPSLEDLQRTTPRVRYGKLAEKGIFLQ
jgi:hypothetical protein